MTPDKNVERMLVISEAHLDAAGRVWVRELGKAAGDDFRLLAVLRVEDPAPPSSALAVTAVAKERASQWVIFRAEHDSARHDLIEGLPIYEDVE